MVEVTWSESDQQKHYENLKEKLRLETLQNFVPSKWLRFGLNRCHVVEQNTDGCGDKETRAWHVETQLRRGITVDGESPQEMQHWLFQLTS